jgi:hypothetical protein
MNHKGAEGRHEGARRNNPYHSSFVCLYATFVAFVVNRTEIAQHNPEILPISGACSTIS